MADDIEGWERRAPQKLIERGAMTLRELTDSAEIDRFAMPSAQVWIDNALERGSIEAGWNASPRYNITAVARSSSRCSDRWLCGQ